jgi:Holliday junction resolvasome RuvABC DNA-binding subunit
MKNEREHSERQPDDARDDSRTTRDDVFSKLLPALCNLGFSKQRATKVVTELRERPIEPGVEPILRAALAALVSS